MLISHRKNFIYTKTFKTAGTSVESYFEPYCMPEGEWTNIGARDVHVSDAGIIGFRGSKKPKDIPWFNHMPAERIKSQIGDEIWNRYFKFCVIRDPFDKTVSAFFQHRKYIKLGLAKVGAKTLKKRLYRLLRPEPKFHSVKDEFEHWLQNIGMPVDRDKYLIDGEFCVDEVIRYENL